MAVMAPRMLLRERGSSMRRDAVTGSFTGAAAGAAGAAAEPLSWPTAPAAQINNARSTSECFTKILLILFFELTDKSFPCEVRPVSHAALRERCANRCPNKREEDPPAENDGIGRAA